MKIALSLLALVLLATCVASVSVSVLQRIPGKVIVREPELDYFLDDESTLDSNYTACYKNTTDRGVGTIPNTCPEGQERNGALCYPLCKANYTGVGPVCWQDCPPGYKDTGAFCQPDSQWGDNHNCPLKDKCGLIYNSTKDCVICPAGMHADGCICKNPGKLFAKDSYGRGAGYLMQCAAGLEEQAGLCYKPCPAGSDGVGPVCWENCNGNYSYSCGGAICTPAKKECSRQLNGLAKNLVKLQIQLAKCLFDSERSKECRDSWMQKREAVKKIISTADVDEEDEDEKNEDESVFHRLYNFFHESFMTYHHGNDSHHGNHSHHHHHHHHHHHDHNRTHCNATEIEQQINNILQQLDLPTCNQV